MVKKYSKKKGGTNELKFSEFPNSVEQAALNASGGKSRKRYKKRGGALNPLPYSMYPGQVDAMNMGVPSNIPMFSPSSPLNRALGASASGGKKKLRKGGSGLASNRSSNMINLPGNPFEISSDPLNRALAASGGGRKKSRRRRGGFGTSLKAAYGKGSFINLPMNPYAMSSDPLNRALMATNGGGPPPSLKMTNYPSNNTIMAPIDLSALPGDPLNRSLGAALGGGRRRRKGGEFTMRRSRRGGQGLMRDIKKLQNMSLSNSINNPQARALMASGGSGLNRYWNGCGSGFSCTGSCPDLAPPLAISNPYNAAGVGVQSGLRVPQNIYGGRKRSKKAGRRRILRGGNTFYSPSSNVSNSTSVSDSTAWGVSNTGWGNSAALGNYKNLPTPYSQNQFLAPNGGVFYGSNALHNATQQGNFPATLSDAQNFWPL